MSKRKSNITLEDVGGFYLNDEKVYQLEEFKPEPQVTMLNFADSDKIEGSLSSFADFVRLKPEKPRARKVEKPVSETKSHKTRRDKGTQHKKTDKSLIPLEIHTSANGQETIVRIGKQEGKGQTLRGAVEDVLKVFNGNIPDFLSVEDKKTLQDILDSKGG